MPSDIFVVGGGVAGLTLARDVALGGRRVHVIEREDRTGGQVTALDVEAHQLDAAAESFATRTTAVSALIAELGLSDRVVMPLDAPAWIYREDGTALPLPATGLLGVPSSPFAADVRASIGVAGAARAWADRVLPRRVGADATTFGDLVTARMGRRVTERLVGPITRGVHSSEPDALPIAAAHPALAGLVTDKRSLARAIREVRRIAPAGSAVASLRGGMHTLPIALAASAVEAGVDLHRGTVATEISASSVTFDGRTHHGEVVMAAPPAGAPTRNVTLVTVVASARAWQSAPRGTGVLVTRGAPGVSARALTHVSAKWEWVARAFEGKQVVRLSYDGATPEPLAKAVNDAALLMGSAPEAIHTVLERRWARATPLAEADRGTIRWVGEAASGTGLAAVVAHARRTATEMLASSK